MEENFAAELDLGAYLCNSPGEIGAAGAVSAQEWANVEDSVEVPFEYEGPVADNGGAGTGRAVPAAAAGARSVYAGPAGGGVAAPAGTAPGREPARSLGVWRFDKKKEKRVYVSLTGERLEGRRAFTRQREDQLSEAFSNRSARGELVQMLHYGPTCMSDLGASGEPVSLAALGLPARVCARYEAGMVRHLFPWQVQCLMAGDGSVLRGESNLVYSAPTSGGKTLVAEMLMLRRLAHLQGAHREESSPQGAAARTHGFGTILFVVPFVALAEEKAAYFQNMWQDMKIGVQSYHGDDEGRVLTPDVEVAVCTIEKANIIVNQLIDGSSGGAGMQQLSMIVVDELHLVSDSKRGFLLEVLLSKARFVWGTSIQIVGLSATLPNLDDISKWLGGVLYCTQYRPVELKTRICVGRALFDPSAGLSGSAAAAARGVLPLHEYPERMFAPADPTAPRRALDLSKYQKQLSYLRSADPDGLLSLCVETVLLEKKSVIVFCPAKKWCERAATIVSEALAALREIEGGVASDLLEGGGSTLGKDRCLQKISCETSRLKGGRRLLFRLLQCPVAVCPVLEKTLVQGVAYHHAGLTMDERKVVEKGFRDGLVSVLCATSTLAAGVNLPAHRVIIRSPKMGPTDLSVASFRQMCGRAGRMNMDTEGEAILMVQSTVRERNLALTLTTTGELPPLCSGIKDGSGGGIARLLLEIIYCERANTDEDLDKYLAYTLWAAQECNGERAEAIQAAKQSAMALLLDHEFIVLVIDPAAAGGANSGEASHRKKRRRSRAPAEPACRRYIASPLGRATTLSGVPPSDAVVVLRSLQEARERLVLKSGFHSIFLSTPPSTSIEPNWSNFEPLLARLRQEYPDTTTALEVLGVDYFELERYARAPPKMGSAADRVMFYRRLYSAVLLFCLIQEMPLTKVADAAALNRGQVQQLQKEASTFCGMAISFCRKLNWGSLASVLEAYAGRLSFGVTEELLPLVRLGAQVMPPFRARMFFKNNIKSPQDIISVGVEAVTKLLVRLALYFVG